MHLAVTRLLPALLCLLYASLLLSLRHHPLVLAHWQEALQAPRILAFSAALWVGLRHRPRDPARLVGMVMAGSAGILVVGGRWGAGWSQVQAFAALSWGVAGAIVYRARARS